MSGATVVAQATTPAVRRLSQHLTHHPRRVWWLLVALVFGLLTIIGANSSHSGIGATRGKGGGGAPGAILPFFKESRSDEWAKWTPWDLGILQSGDTSFAPPVSFPRVSLAAVQINGPIEAGVYWDNLSLYLGKFLPQAQLFAFHWWVAIALFLVLLPQWLSRFGVRYAYGVPAALFCVLAPVTMWFTYLPVRVGVWPLLGCVALVEIHHRLPGVWERSHGRWWRLALLGLLGLVGSFAFVRTCVSYYPWALAMGLTFAVPTLVLLFRTKGRRVSALILLACVGLVTAGIGALFLAANRDQLATFLGTVYPGQRIVSGQLVETWRLLSAADYWVAERTQSADFNKSSRSSSYVALLLAGIVLLPFLRRTRMRVPLSAIIALGAVIIVLASWVLIDWPTGIGQSVPLLNRVPPPRVAQIIGLPSAIFFALTFTAFVQSQRGRQWLATGITFVVVSVATIFGGYSLRSDIGQPGVVGIYATALVAGLVLAFAVHYRNYVWAFVPAVVAVCAVVAVVNPLTVGLGYLRDSGNAVQVQRLAESLPPGERWATDSWNNFDSVLMANGQPSISGQQWVGPLPDQWRRLVGAAPAQTWNRGASTVQFRWESDDSPLTVSNRADVILIQASPCDAALRQFGLRLVISSRPLTNSCLTALPSGAADPSWHFYRVGL